MRFIFVLGLAGPEDSTVPNESHAIAGMFMAVFERKLGDAGLVELAEVFCYHAVVLFLCGARERQIDVRLRASSAPNRRRPHRHALRSYRAALRRALRPAPPTNLVLRARTISKPAKSCEN